MRMVANMIFEGLDVYTSPRWYTMVDDGEQRLVLAGSGHLWLVIICKC